MSQSPASSPSFDSEDDSFFSVSYSWMKMEKRKIELRKQLADLEQKQKDLENSFPQISNLRGLTHSQLKINLKPPTPSQSVPSTMSPPISYSSSSSSSSSSLSSPISSLSVSDRSLPSPPKKQKLYFDTVMEEHKWKMPKEKKDKKEKKTNPDEPTKSKKNREKAKKRLLAKLKADAAPVTSPSASLLVNTKEVNKTNLEGIDLEPKNNSGK